MPTPKFDLPVATFLRLDLFPSLLLGDTLPNRHPGDVLDSKRVIITDTHVLIFSDSQLGPELTHTWELVDIEGRNTIGWTISAHDPETEQTHTFLLRRSSGCGCGTRLRGIHPYPGVPRKSI